MIAIIGATALVAVVALTVALWPKPQGNNGSGTTSEPGEIGASTTAAGKLTPQQLIELNDKLAAATTNVRLERFEDARPLLVEVLEKYDCRNEEARRSLSIVDKAKLDELVAACK